MPDLILDDCEFKFLLPTFCHALKHFSHIFAKSKDFKGVTGDKAHILHRRCIFPPPLSVPASLCLLIYVIAQLECVYLKIQSSQKHPESGKMM